MNEKLKEAAGKFRNDCWPYDEPPSMTETLAAAARGEIPGFQLVPVEPTEKMMRPSDDWCDVVTNARIYCAMLAASKEEFK